MKIGIKVVVNDEVYPLEIKVPLKDERKEEHSLFKKGDIVLCYPQHCGPNTGVPGRILTSVGDDRLGGVDFLVEMFLPFSEGHDGGGTGIRGRCWWLRKEELAKVECTPVS